MDCFSSNQPNIFETLFSTLLQDFGAIDGLRACRTAKVFAIIMIFHSLYMYVGQLYLALSPPSPRAECESVYSRISSHNTAANVSQGVNYPLY